MLFIVLGTYVTMALANAELPVELAPVSIVRGRFPGATRHERAVWVRSKEYVSRCTSEAAFVVRAELKKAGIPAPNLSSNEPYGDATCSAVVNTIALSEGFKSWPLFTRALRPAQQAFATIRFSFYQLRRFEREGFPAETDSLERTDPARRFDEAVVLKTAGDQALRLAIDALSDGRDVLRLKAPAKRVLMSLLWSAATYQSRENTNWLKLIIDRRGWPLISLYGTEASTASWLIVQHSDHDPAFQVRISKMLASYVSDREIAANEYALLVDRVQIALTGSQTFGTQQYCVNHMRSPLPVSEPGSLDDRRRAVGLPPLEKLSTTPC